MPFEGGGIIYEYYEALPEIKHISSRPPSPKVFIAGNEFLKNHFISRFISETMLGISSVWSPEGRAGRTDTPKRIFTALSHPEVIGNLPLHNATPSE